LSLRRQDSEGAKLADLPIEQATKFEFVPDLKDRQALGPRCADATLLRADEVIRTLLRCMSLQMCWFLDAGNAKRSAGSTGRRPKTAKARSRGQLSTG